MPTLVTDLGNGNIREETNNAPAIETGNARMEQFGPFREVNPAANQAATAMTVGGVDAEAPTGVVAMKAGQIVGVAADSSAALTAGTATFQATKGGTASGTTCVLDSTHQTRVTLLATPIAFKVGDKLGIKLATSSGYLPVTADQQAYLLIQWTPADG